jgi:hypothetical protein
MELHPLLRQPPHGPQRLVEVAPEPRHPIHDDGVGLAGLQPPQQLVERRPPLHVEVLARPVDVAEHVDQVQVRHGAPLLDLLELDRLGQRLAAIAAEVARNPDVTEGSVAD